MADIQTGSAALGGMDLRAFFVSLDARALAISNNVREQFGELEVDLT
jgi:hypothetical protein